MKEKKWVLMTMGSKSLPLQERMFRLISMMGLLGLAARIALGCIRRNNWVNLATLSIAFFILALVLFITFRMHKFQTGSVVAVIVTLYLILPAHFLTAGGVSGDAMLWFILGFVLAALVLEGKVKYLIIAGGYALVLACCYFAYSHPELMVSQSRVTIYVNSIAGLTIITTVICAMLQFQSESYRAENEKAIKQKKEIEELNRAQNSFFSSMSHEIRTPINTIVGFNEMILREAVTEEVILDAQNIQSASKMLLSIINDILDMSKMESGKMDLITVPYDVGTMVSEIVPMIWVKAKEKGLEFHVNVDENMPRQLLGDEVRIKQILVNLLGNAIKYTHEGSITLTIQCHRKEGDAVDVSYSVTDTGMGIKKEDIPNLFHAFRRIDEEKNRYTEGTGLGLSIVKLLTDLMGGEISVNSVYMKGSTFAVTLPQKATDTSAIGKLDLDKQHIMNIRDHYRALFEAPKAHVLIVDDNETNLLVEKKLLKDTKVNVDLAQSGVECLKQTGQNEYDVIFMDHLMPDMDGIQCLHMVRNQVGGLNRETPVIVLTANAGAENQALYKREGFHGYLLKPVSGIQLETEVLKYLPPEIVKMTNASGANDVVLGPVIENRKKIAVMITTDSVCDLPKEVTDQYQVKVMPYRVLTAGGEFQDGEEVESDGILAYLPNHMGQVRSQAPTVKDYEEFFAEQLTQAWHIIHITMAQHASKGYENALKASNTFDNVSVVDSGHLSSGMGLIVLYAAKYASGGMSVENILGRIDRLKERASTSFVVGNTNYLAHAKKISNAVNLICEACMLRPVMVLKHSSMKVGAIHIGTNASVRKKYINATLRAPAEIDREILFITHAGLSQEELYEIEARVLKKVPFERVFYQKASPAISANCGPNSFGLLFMKKDKPET